MQKSPFRRDFHVIFMFLTHNNKVTMSLLPASTPVRSCVRRGKLLFLRLLKRQVATQNADCG